ncbi:MAG: hypothetical protein LAT55_13565 [Opitutales bacterium]|nr:hypothetical protein [Opitutales bacterium]
MQIDINKTSCSKALVDPVGRGPIIVFGVVVLMILFRFSYNFYSGALVFEIDTVFYLFAMIYILFFRRVKFYKGNNIAVVDFANGEEYYISNDGKRVIIELEQSKKNGESRSDHSTNH